MINKEKMISRAIKKHCAKTIRTNAWRKTANQFLSEQKYSVHRQDNFCVVVVTTVRGKLLSVGVSKRNPVDADNDSIGLNIAYVRAIEAALDSI